MIIEDAAIATMIVIRRQSRTSNGVASGQAAVSSTVAPVHIAATFTHQCFERTTCGSTVIACQASTHCSRPNIAPQMEHRTIPTAKRLIPFGSDHALGNRAVGLVDPALFGTGLARGAENMEARREQHHSRETDEDCPVQGQIARGPGREGQSRPRQDGGRESTFDKTPRKPEVEADAVDRPEMPGSRTDIVGFLLDRQRRPRPRDRRRAQLLVLCCPVWKVHRLTPRVTWSSIRCAAPCTVHEPPSQLSGLAMRRGERIQPDCSTCHAVPVRSTPVRGHSASLAFTPVLARERQGPCSYETNG